MPDVLRLGVIVNPVSGLGGTAALKGSDGEAIQAEALARGAVPRATERMRHALAACREVHDRLQVLTWGGTMGSDAVSGFELHVECLGASAFPTSAADTQRAAGALAAAGMDLLLFAGGDGTARDLLDVLPPGLPVLGVPAGVKMHSGVFALTPDDAGALVGQLVEGELVASVLAEVRDVDEQALREGRVSSRFYGELPVPAFGGFLQHVKSGGREDEALVVNEIAEYVAERLRERGGTWVLGAGSTLATVKEKLGMQPTLLGVDIAHEGELLVADADARAIERHVDAGSILVLSFARGQGFLLGRGNQQLTPAAVEHIPRESLWVVASRTKLLSLEGRPLRVDTGDAALDRRLAGLVEVTTGYDDAIFYRIGR
jgi:predicted polyphosphate/ATP-dependent NAD kinase